MYTYDYQLVSPSRGDGLYGFVVVEEIETESGHLSDQAKMDLDDVLLDVEWDEIAECLIEVDESQFKIACDRLKKSNNWHKIVG